MTPSRPEAAAQPITFAHPRRRRYDGHPHELIAYVDARRHTFLSAGVATAIGAIAYMAFGLLIAISIIAVLGVLAAALLYGIHLRHRDRAVLLDAGERLREVQAELRIIAPGTDTEEAAEPISIGARSASKW